MTDTPSDAGPVAVDIQAAVEQLRTLVATIQQTVNDIQTAVEQAVAEFQAKLGG